MRLRQQEVELDSRLLVAQLEVVEADDVIGGEGSANVDLEGRGSNPVVGVVEEVAQDVEKRRFVGDHLLKFALERKNNKRFKFELQNCLIDKKKFSENFRSTKSSWKSSRGL